MKTDFRLALAKLVPVFMPDLLFRLGRDGQPLGVRSRDRADRVPAWLGFRHGHHAADRLYAWRWQRGGSNRPPVSA